MKIRKFQKKDVEEIKKMIFDVYKEIYNIEIKDALEDFSEYPLFYVVEDKGKIIGTTALEKEDADTAKLKRMYLIKTYRRKGLGKKLLEMALSFAEKKNYKKIILEVYSKNKAAINFYKKNKFKKIEEKFDKDGKYFVFERNLK